VEPETRAPGVPRRPPPAHLAAPQGWSADEIARRAYADLKPGQYVNLGIGLPTRLLRVAETDPRGVVFHSENGILGLKARGGTDAEDADLIDAGKDLAAVAVGGAFFSHSDSFAMIRGGHIDVAVMGAYQVAANGDFANWTSQQYDSLLGDPRTGAVPAVGGAVDLARGAREVAILLRGVRHAGRSRLVRRCSLPLTGQGCVSKVYCDIGVLSPTGDGFLVQQIADGHTRQSIAELSASLDLALDFE
jgi:3-oxoadipate CoA-transferase beta subunit